MNNKRLSKIIVLAGVLLLGWGAGGGPAESSQAAQDNQLPRFKQEVNVFFKLVQVTVVDKRGNPVTDLAAADFEITDDGKAQKVEHFEIVRQDAGPAPAEAAPAAPRLSRKFFFVFNYAFIEPNGILKARRAALDFLDNYVRPTDELGIISFSMSQGLKINEFLTKDHARIRAVIQGSGTKLYAGRAEQIASLFLRNVGSFMDTESPGESAEAKAGDEIAKEMLRELTAAEAKARLTNYGQSVSYFLTSLRSLAQGLRFVPGNKNMLLFSSGIAGASLFGAPTVDLPENLNSVDAIITWQDRLAVQGGDSRLREFFQKVNEELRAANCPVYSFNVSGPQLGTDVEGMPSTEENALGMKSRDTVGNDSLKVMSSETGGQYFNYTMDLKEAVRRLQKTTDSYYVLGYALASNYDGKFHKIKIKVKRKGCDVFGEGGYYNPKPYAQYSNLEKFVHVMELAEGRTPYLQEGIDVRMAAYPVPVKDKVAVALYSSLPASRFKALGEGPAEIVTILFNARDKVSVYKKTPLYVAALTEDSVFFDQAVGLSPGAYDCRLVVQSLETGRGTSAATKVVIPPALKGSGLTLFPANIFVPGSRPRFQGETGALAVLYPFGVNAVPVVEGLPKDAGKIVAILPCTVSGIDEPDVALTVSLLKAGANETTPLAATLKNSYRGTNVLTMLVEIDLPALEPGPYTLVASVEEKATGAKSQSATNFIAK